MKITKGREPTDQVSMALPPKFLAACRLVFGDDKPATIWGAIVSDDPRINEVRALAARDPKRWFVSRSISTAFRGCARTATPRTKQ